MPINIIVYFRIISIYHSSLCYVFINIVSKNAFSNSVYSYSYSHSIKERERKGKKENKRKKARILHARDSRTYTRIETQSFHRKAGKGWAGSCGEAEGLYVKQGRQEGSRGAPSYFTVITVTCYRARSLRHAINRRLPLLWR